ncbi:MAG: glycosyltransferase, partial [Clostridiaceae bacterium]
EGFVRAFCRARSNGTLPEDAALYIVCSASDEMIDSLKQETRASGCHFGKDVIVTNFIPDEEMLTLLSTARASVFPSLYEGLGLPILESYVAGTPCWASGVSATREFVPAECSFDPFDQASMVNAIERIYADDAICARSLAFGRKLIQTVNWDTAAEKMLKKLQELTQSRA